MSAIRLKILPCLAALLLVVGAIYGVYHFGGSVRDAQWQARWDARDAKDAQAPELNEATERTKEQSHQQAINKVVQNDQALIDTAAAAVTAVNRESDRLRSAADGLASCIAASQGGSHSCTAAASAAASRAVLVLADVLKRADQRAGDLAVYADQSHGRGLTCDQSYDAISQ